MSGQEIGESLLQRTAGPYGHGRPYAVGNRQLSVCLHTKNESISV